MRVDRVTKSWIACESDEYAASLGMRVDEARIDHFFDAMRHHIVLWEGEYAGKHFEPLTWHYECLGAVFGWVRFDEHFGRWVRRFKVASIWIGKKNGKSPTGAIVGIYLTRFDGEHGNQVFSAARDGKQAMIVHNNAIQMVKHSPTLSEELKINKVTGRIVWDAGASYYEPMSSDNMLSQEGRNGSCILDEVHTVDDKLARIITDMGASRAEALRFEISTGGCGVESYGRKQWEYGQQVRDNRIIDPYLFFRAYTVPEDVPDKDLCKLRNGKPTKKTLQYWQMANPALGEVLPVSDLIQSCNRAQRSEADWAAWKQRRLNIWQQAASPWLAGTVWTHSQLDVAYDDLEGAGGGLGIDLARVNDITAAVAVVPRDDQAILWPRFWLSEDRYETLVNKHVPQLADWRAAGHVIVTDGTVTDYAAVEQGIVDLIQHIGSSVVCYDPAFATELMQRIGSEIDMLALEFKQNMSSYSAPTLDFKRGLLSGEIGHNGNPMLTWQAGHVMVAQRGKLVIPIKPKDRQYCSIDGIVGAIMGSHAYQISGDGVSRDAIII